MIPEALVICHSRKYIIIGKTVDKGPVMEAHRCNLNDHNCTFSEMLVLNSCQKVKENMILYSCGGQNKQRTYKTKVGKRADDDYSEISDHHVLSEVDV